MIMSPNPPPAKVALVTGASRGLGRVVAAFLGERGFALVLTARGRADLEALAKELRGKGATVEAIAGDVASEEHRWKLVRAAGSFGRLDLLFNNASELGATPLPALADAKLDDVRRVLEVNLIAPIALVQLAVPLLSKSQGLVVNISSDAAAGGYPSWGVYGASKAALDLASKTLAAELKGSGVSVVAVDPGDMRTKMHQDAYPGQDISDRPTPDVAVPFLAWLLGQDPKAVSGARFQAQSSLWEVPA